MNQEPVQPVALNLRLPPEIHRRLKSLAQAEWRSLNQEIIRRLSLSIAADERAVRP